MLRFSSKEAIQELEHLLRAVAKGEEIVIIGADGAAVKLVALPYTPQPVFGSAKGLVSIGPDFDSPIEDFEEYMP